MPMWWKRPKTEALKAREEAVAKRPSWWRFGQRRQFKRQQHALNARSAVEEIANLTEQRDAMIESVVNEHWTHERKPGDANYESTMAAARGFALHDPAIAAFQKEINPKIAELDQRINLRKTADALLKQRVREIPSEIQELQAQKKQWESQFVRSTDAERKQAQGMLNTIERRLGEKRFEFKQASKRSGGIFSLQTALEIVAGPSFVVSQLGFSGGGQYHGLTQFGSNKNPGLGVRKKNH